MYAEELILASSNVFFPNQKLFERIPHILGYKLIAGEHTVSIDLLRVIYPGCNLRSLRNSLHQFVGFRFRHRATAPKSAMCAR